MPTHTLEHLRARAARGELSDEEVQSARQFGVVPFQEIKAANARARQRPGDALADDLAGGSAPQMQQGGGIRDDVLSAMALGFIPQQHLQQAQNMSQAPFSSFGGPVRQQAAGILGDRGLPPGRLEGAAEIAPALRGQQEALIQAMLSEPNPQIQDVPAGAPQQLEQPVIEEGQNIPGGRVARGGGVGRLADLLLTGAGARGQAVRGRI